MNIIPKSVQDLVDELGRLPGIGPRTAERLAFHLLKSDAARADALGSALTSLHAGVHACRECGNFAEAELCAVCAASDRQRSVVAVVEEPFDVVALEKTGLYKGLYHVLGGVISPMDGVGPERLNIHSLVRRVKDGGVEEVILATNPTVEGESTGLYLRSALEPYSIKFTRLARGLPAGSDLEYADQVTLGRALQGRQAF